MVEKKALYMKNVRDFDHIHSGMRTERDNEQQPKEQYKRHNIDYCKYCGLAHGQRQCLASGKACSTCGKQNHFNVLHQVMCTQTCLE